MPLLPSGLQDSLPPSAKRDRFITNVLLDRFALFGYEQVTPPLLEFEETLLKNKGEAHQNNSFRVMDNFSQKLMAIRSDITPQIERIALKQINNAQIGNNAAIPIRLCYAGQVLRMKPSHAGGKRQLRQAGLELIGEKTHIKAEEVLFTTLEALERLGLNTLVISVSYGNLLPNLLPEIEAESRDQIIKAINHKDYESLPKHTPNLEIIQALINNELDLALSFNHTAINQAINEINSFITQMKSYVPNITIHADILDVSDFPYHTGICFAILDKKTRLELGRGGCYHLNDVYYGCGATLYVDNLLGTEIETQKENETKILQEEDFFTKGKQLRDSGCVTILK
jgi:ATP phosphoribosyltransferase regulatory subunit